MRARSFRNAIVSLGDSPKTVYAGLAIGVAIFAVSASVLGVLLFSHFRDGDGGNAQSTSPFSRGVIPGNPPSDTDFGAPPAVSTPPPMNDGELPSRIVIKSIGVDAPVVPLGLDEEDVPQVPLNGTTVGWYYFSSLPVKGNNAVFSGHVEWGADRAVFERLPEVAVGDRVEVSMMNGTTLRYDVVVRFEIDPTDPSNLYLMGPTAGDVITLITCGGTWEPDPDKFFGGDYSERLVVRAILVPGGPDLPGFAGF